MLFTGELQDLYRHVFKIQKPEGLSMNTPYPETEIGEHRENGNKYLEPNVDWDVVFTDLPFLTELTAYNISVLQLFKNNFNVINCQDKSFLPAANVG